MAGINSSASRKGRCRSTLAVLPLGPEGAFRKANLRDDDNPVYIRTSDGSVVRLRTLKQIRDAERSGLGPVSVGRLRAGETADFVPANLISEPPAGSPADSQGLAVGDELISVSVSIALPDGTVEVERATSVDPSRMYALLSRAESEGARVDLEVLSSSGVRSVSLSGAPGRPGSYGVEAPFGAAVPLEGGGWGSAPRSVSLDGMEPDEREKLLSAGPLALQDGDRLLVGSADLGLRLADYMEFSDAGGPEAHAAAALHEMWRKGFEAEHGVGAARIKDDGEGGECDINAPYSELPPRWQAENLAAATHAVGLVHDSVSGALWPEGLPEGADVIELMASEVHDAWLERNGSWADESLKVPYDLLPESEKEKDREVVRVALRSWHRGYALEQVDAQAIRVDPSSGEESVVDVQFPISAASHVLSSGGSSDAPSVFHAGSSRALREVESADVSGEGGLRSILASAPPALSDLEGARRRLYGSGSKLQVSEYAGGAVSPVDAALSRGSSPAALGLSSADVETRVAAAVELLAAEGVAVSDHPEMLDRVRYIQNLSRSSWSDRVSSGTVGEGAIVYDAIASVPVSPDGSNLEEVARWVASGRSDSMANHAVRLRGETSELASALASPSPGFSLSQTGQGTVVVDTSRADSRAGQSGGDASLPDVSSDAVRNLGYSFGPAVVARDSAGVRVHVGEGFDAGSVESLRESIEKADASGDLSGPGAWEVSPSRDGRGFTLQPRVSSGVPLDTLAGLVDSHTRFLGPSYTVHGQEPSRREGRFDLISDPAGSMAVSGQMRLDRLERGRGDGPSSSEEDLPAHLRPAGPAFRVYDPDGASGTLMLSHDSAGASTPTPFLAAMTREDDPMGRRVLVPSLAVDHSETGARRVSILPGSYPASSAAFLDPARRSGPQVPGEVLPPTPRRRLVDALLGRRSGPRSVNKPPLALSGGSKDGSRPRSARRDLLSSSIPSTSIGGLIRGARASRARSGGSI